LYWGLRESRVEKLRGKGGESFTEREARGRGIKVKGKEVFWTEEEE